MAEPFPLPALTPEAARRLRRLQRVAWVLDRLIPLGKKWRIGLEPIIGLIPGIGDWLGGLLSTYIVYEAACLGLPWGILGLMMINVAAESILGVVPVAGDLFDVVWQANMRNLRLVERHYRPDMSPRPLSRILFALIAVLLLLLAGIFAMLVATVWILWKIIG
jgi:Domain of unknown function (DUF4112)